MTLTVIDEWATLRLVADQNLSLARYGDGEWKLMMEHGTKGHDVDADMGKQLRRIAQAPHDRVLVAIPRIFDGIPAHKRGFWERYTAPDRTRFFSAGYVYGSSFVTRPDIFPELDCPDYWALMRSIWADRPLLLVKGAPEGEKVKRPSLFDNAAWMETLAAPPRNAWLFYRRLFDDCRRWHRHHPEGLIVLCVGAAATVMAHHLGAAGMQALDMGHAPNYYAKRGTVEAGEKP